MTAFKTIWPDFWLPSFLLSTPFDLIFILCTQLTPFKTIWPDFSLCTTIDSFQYHKPDFSIVYPTDSFQKFYLILSVCTQLTPFKTIWHNFMPLCILFTNFKTIWPHCIKCSLLTPFKTILPDFIIGYPIDSFQDHMTWFLHCVPHWLLSRPYDLIFALYTQLTPFNTI